MSIAFPATNERAPMFRVSLILEALRAHPALMFWVAALAQGMLWTLVPSLFYAAPPGDVPLTLAVGKEWPLGSPYGPPLAPWAANLAFELAGKSIVGVYLLSQACVVATYWAVFALGRRMLGAAHAAMAILLMAGISVFTVPTLEFGPTVLAMPLTAAALLFCYRALADNRRFDWATFGAALGLLILTTYAGLILLGLIALFMLATARGRSRLLGIGPIVALLIVVLVNVPHVIWLHRIGFDPLPAIKAIPALMIGEKRLTSWANLLLLLVFSHAGLVVLAAVAGGMLAGRSASAPAVERVPIDPFARNFVYFFALAPVLAMSLLALFTRRPENFLAAPLVLLSGLAVVVAAGKRIKIAHQYMIGYAWLALIALPPLLVAFTVVLQPWVLAADLRIGRPADEIGRFFGDSFARRTGKPLTVVAGDQSLASLIAIGAPSRPSLYVDDVPDDRSHVTRQDIADEGAVVVWPAVDTAGRPPPEIARLFPDLAVEVPRAFERTFQGRMPLMRIGWGMIRPRVQASAPTAPRPLPAEPTPAPVVQSPSPQLAPESSQQWVPSASQPQAYPKQAEAPSQAAAPQNVTPEPSSPPRRQRPRPRPFVKMHTPQW